MTDELERLAREATPGPWHGPSTHGIAVNDDGTYVYTVDENNRAYILAASPDVILALLEERRVLRERVEAWAGSVRRLVAAAPIRAVVEEVGLPEPMHSPVMGQSETAM